MTCNNSYWYKFKYLFTCSKKILFANTWKIDEAIEIKLNENKE